MKCETITRTESAAALVRIVTPKDTPETSLWLGHQFAPTINEAVGTAIQRAARKELGRHATAGKLDKYFQVQD
jgi:hypothetical protein